MQQAPSDHEKVEVLPINLSTNSSKSPADEILQQAPRGHVVTKKREQGRKGSSCTLCRRGKRKCDGEKPCRRCMIRGPDIASMCAAEGKPATQLRLDETGTQLSNEKLSPLALPSNCGQKPIARTNLVRTQDTNSISTIQLALRFLQNSNNGVPTSAPSVAVCDPPSSKIRVIHSASTASSLGSFLQPNSLHVTSPAASTASPLALGVGWNGRGVDASKGDGGFSSFSSLLQQGLLPPTAAALR